MNRITKDMKMLTIPESREDGPASPATSDAALHSDDSEVYFYPSTCKPAAKVAEIFDKSGIPNLLWGEWAAATIGGFAANQVSELHHLYFTSILY